MFERPKNRIGVIERRSVAEGRRALPAVNVDAVPNMVVNLLKQLKLVQELPVPPQPPIRRRPQQPRLVAREMRLGMNEADRTCCYCCGSVARMGRRER